MLVGTKSGQRSELLELCRTRRVNPPSGYTIELWMTGPKCPPFEEPCPE